MADAHEEGWYTDPFGRHDARWMSAGSPTKLVRDGDQESYDDPPDGEPSVTPTAIAETQMRDGRDLLRSGEGDDGVSLRTRMGEAGEFGATWGSHIALPDLHEDS